MNTAITENLRIFDDFIQSDQYRDLVGIGREDCMVAEFLEHIMLRYSSIKFFLRVDVNRATLESHELASMICDYLGYDQ